MGLCGKAEDLTVKSMKLINSKSKRIPNFRKSTLFANICSKTVFFQELCLIRFHPATEEEEVAYVSLFSYFSSRKRFGVVANSNKRIKDLYLIPLSSKDPLPAKLLPFDGPGKHLHRFLSEFCS